MKFVFGMLHRVFKKIVVCEVRFWDAVLVDVVPMGGSQIFKKICVCEVRFWDAFRPYSHFRECIKDLGQCREFNSNASDENGKVLSLGGGVCGIGRSRVSSRAHGT